MKSFPNRKPDAENPFGTVAVLSQVCSGDGKQNLNVKDIRERIRILDAVERPGPVIVLDNQLHTKLVELINAFPFAVAHRGLLTILDDVENANDVLEVETGV